MTLQGHPRSLFLAPIESTYGTSYWSTIATSVLLSGHVSEILKFLCAESRDVTEPANIRVRWIRISCAKSVGFGCGFVARSKLPATIVTVIQLSYLKLSSCK